MLVGSQIAGVTSLSGRGHVNRRISRKARSLINGRVLRAVGLAGWLKGGNLSLRRQQRQRKGGSRQTGCSGGGLVERRGSYRQLVIQPKLACFGVSRESVWAGRAAVQSR